MAHNDWSRLEVEAIVNDYLSMLRAQLAGIAYNKTKHRKALVQHLNNRSDTSVEFKHQNISAALIELNFPYISGYKPRSNFQAIVKEIVAEALERDASIQALAAADADQPIVVPEVDDILKALIDRPVIKLSENRKVVAEPTASFRSLTTNYIEREARNRSLGEAGELFVLRFEQARLISCGKEPLAQKIEHTSKVRGDGAGYDILSFDVTGKERLIEVKTTKYGQETPFFVTRNEVSVSAANPDLYHLYRVFTFRIDPKMYALGGAIDSTCRLTAATFSALPR